MRETGPAKGDLSMSLEVRIANGTVVTNPEERIKEYCDIEICKGYDDCYDANNEITLSEINLPTC